MSSDTSQKIKRIKSAKYYIRQLKLATINKLKNTPSMNEKKKIYESYKKNISGLISDPSFKHIYDEYKSEQLLDLDFDISSSNTDIYQNSSPDCNVVEVYTSDFEDNVSRKNKYVSVFDSTLANSVCVNTGCTDIYSESSNKIEDNNEEQVNVILSENEKKKLNDFYNKLIYVKTLLEHQLKK